MAKSKDKNILEKAADKISHALHLDGDTHPAHGELDQKTVEDLLKDDSQKSDEQPQAIQQQKNEHPKFDKFKKGTVEND